MRKLALWLFLLVLLIAPRAEAASRYWVGGTASWDATAGTKWATSSGGTGGAAVPTASDDVFLDANSGAVTVTLAASATCNNLNATGFTGTLAGSSALAVSASLTWGSGMTLTYTGTITFNATTSQTITSNGKSWSSPITFNGVAGTWTQQDALTTTGTITLTNGTYSTNGFSLTCPKFSSANSNTRVWTITNSAVTLNGTGTILDLSTSTNATVNGSGSSITLSDASASSKTFSVASGGTLTFGDVIFSGGGSGSYTTTWGLATYRDITVSNTGGATFTWSGGPNLRNFDMSNFTGTFATGGNTHSVSGNFTIGSSVTNNWNGQLIYACTGTCTITTHGATMANTITELSTNTGTIQFGDDYNGTNTLTHTAGTIDANGHNVKFTTITVNGSTTRTVNCSGGSYTGTSTGSIFSISGSGYSVQSTCTFKGSDSSSTGKTFALGSITIATLEIVNAGTGAFAITGANTFALKIDTAKTTVTFPSSTTTTLTGWTGNGTSGNLNVLQSSSPGTQYTLSSASKVCLDYYNITDSKASQTNTFFAGTHSTGASGQNNTNWSFTACPTGASVSRTVNTGGADGGASVARIPNGS